MVYKVDIKSLIAKETYEIQRVPLKFNSRYLAQTLKYKILYEVQMYEVKDLIARRFNINGSLHKI